jgi:hypothetical protein
MSPDAHQVEHYMYLLGRRRDELQVFTVIGGPDELKETPQGSLVDPQKLVAV